MVDQNQDSIIAKATEEQQLQHAVDPANYLLYHARCTNPFCCCCFGSNNSSMKRRSPSSSATTATEHRACKKLFRENQGLTLNGVTPEHAHVVASASYLSPLPQSVKGFVYDDPTPTPSPATDTTFTPSSNRGDKGVILTNAEASNSMRLRRMKDYLREMRKWWDEVMREEEEEEEEDDHEGAEGDKVLSKDDDCGGDAEEAVRIEWADKCLNICFKCPCSKGYQILLSGNNCYYKLV